MLNVLTSAIQKITAKFRITLSMQRVAPRVSLSLGLLLVVLGVSVGAWHLWSPAGPTITPAGRFVVALGIAFLSLGCVLSQTLKKRLPRPRDFTDVFVWSLGLFAIFLTDWIVRPWSFFQGPSIRGELILVAFIAYGLLGIRWKRYSLCFPLFSIGLILWSFFLESRGRLLFSDDHAMFIFRLKLLAENFPNIPFWSPLWNSGFDARDFFATGALNFFLLFSPILYTFPVERVHSILVAALLWLILPLSLYCSARLLKLSKAAGYFAATLGLSTGVFWYRWALKYGTLGFVTSSTLLPLVLTVWLAFLRTKTPSKKLAIMLVTSTTLMALWSPSILAALPVGIFFLIALPRIATSKRHILTVIVIISLNLPWMMMMWKVSNVGKFLNISTTTHSLAGEPETQRAADANISKPKIAFRHQQGSLNLKKALTQWQNNATALNPLIVILGLPSILCLGRRERLFFGTLISWLLFLGTVMVPLKPQLELDRMIVMASVVLCIPLGRLLVRVFLSAKKSPSLRFGGAIVGAFLLLGPFSTGTIILNRSEDTYSFAEEHVHDLAKLLKDNAVQGRVFFTGCVLHELNGGHIAPLTLWSETEMIATSYAHNIWTYTQPFPEEVLRGGIPLIERYLDARNVSLVIAHEPRWIELLRKDSPKYQFLGKHERFSIFKIREYRPNLVLQGSIRELNTTTNSISFIPSTETITLNYAYYPFLEVDKGTISETRGEFGLSYISIAGYPPGERITLQSVSPFKRLTM